jgi:hypothetical protein
MRVTSSARFLVLGAFATLPLLIAQACAPGDDGTGSGTSAAGGEAPLFDADLGDGSINEDAACGNIKLSAKIVPVTLYVMLDKSSSMSGTKWNAATAGLSAFVNDPGFSDLVVGLNFFPRPPDAVPACDQNAYATPKVPFGPLSSNAAAITAALAAEAPDGFSTPIYPALGGAILAGIEVAKNDPNMGAAVLLVTDGLPQGPAPTCSGVNPEDANVIADLAHTGATYTPPVKTFVVGLPGADQDFSNLVAASGGTDEAILVASDNIQQEFTDALAKVAGSALPCEYYLPDQVSTGEIDTDRVNILFTPGPTAGGEPETIALNYDCSGDGEGWHYDNPSSPTKILLCPTTCERVRADLEASIQILLGCETVVAK